MAANNKIHFILTGGTIDSVWVGAKDTVEVSKKSTLPEYFEELDRNLKAYNDFEFTEACMKDSRDITDDDRKKILELIENSDANKFIITHGTYTMPHTSRYLKENLKREDATIVLTGATVPVKGFYFSDGPINLGYALAQVQQLKPGVYVAMNLHVFDPEEVDKDTEIGRFYSFIRNLQ